MIGETTYKITVSRADSDVIKNLVDILENCPMGLNILNKIKALVEIY